MSQPTAPNETAPAGREALVALALKAAHGDESALPAVRELLRDAREVDAAGGDLARYAQRRLIDSFCGENLLAKEALARKLELLRAELGGAGAAPLERLLVERVVACWLHLHHLELAYAATGGAPGGPAAYYQRSITSAQRRYLAGIKALALLRRLALPVLQVNVARARLSVASPAAAPVDGTNGKPAVTSSRQG